MSFAAIVVLFFFPSLGHRCDNDAFKSMSERQCDKQKNTCQKHSRYT